MSGTNGKKVLDAGAITGAQDVRYEDAEVPEWGGTARLRVMTAGAREQWESALVGADPDKPPPHVRSRLLALTLVDETGALLFPDLEAGITVLDSRDSKVVDRLTEIALRLNRLGKEGLEAARKASEPTPPESPITDSPSGSGA